MKSRLASVALVLGLLTSGLAVYATEPVTVDNFIRAESDMTFPRYVKQGAFGRIFHIRGPTPIDKQDVIRMNRDKIYPKLVLLMDATVSIEVISGE